MFKKKQEAKKHFITFSRFSAGRFVEIWAAVCILG